MIKKALVSVMCFIHPTWRKYIWLQYSRYSIIILNSGSNLLTLILVCLCRNEPWHKECFVCQHCGCQLAGQKFASRYILIHTIPPFSFFQRRHLCSPLLAERRNRTVPPVLGSCLRSDAPAVANQSPARAGPGTP